MNAAAEKSIGKLHALLYGSAVLAVVSGVGILLDPRTLDGVSVWLKPTKFALSIFLYCATFSWMLRQLTQWPRVARWAADVTRVALVLELALIVIQAARGRASHFNVATLWDGAVFTVMGTAIALQTLAALTAAVALWRQPLADPALGWGMRLGLAIAVVGASSGGLMTAPTSEQMAQMVAQRGVTRSGQHTVGAPDGGPGLWGTGWSREHGDLRVPHFVGLHAMQALPLVGWLLVRRRRRMGVASNSALDVQADVRVVFAAAVSYVALFVALLTQALRGASVIAPESVEVLVGWALGSFVFMGVAWMWPRRLVRARSVEAA